MDEKNGRMLCCPRKMCDFFWGSEDCLIYRSMYLKLGVKRIDRIYQSLVHEKHGKNVLVSRRSEKNMSLYI